VRWDRGGGGGLSLAVQLSAGMEWQLFVVADKNMKLKFENLTKWLQQSEPIAGRSKGKSMVYTGKCSATNGKQGLHIAHDDFFGEMGD